MVEDLFTFRFTNRPATGSDSTGTKKRFARLTNRTKRTNRAKRKKDKQGKKKKPTFLLTRKQRRLGTGVSSVI